MIPRQEDTFSVESNFDGREQDLTVDLANVPHLMKLLTNQYSDPIATIVREYSINALDSHIEADNSAPIEIFLPTPLRSTFIVQDYGVGLSEDELFDVYTKYGASTKRDTDTVAGMMGLGSKSALAYTDQFSIRAVKDGIKTDAILGRNEKGGGKIRIIRSDASKEPNSVRVTIPVRDSQKFIKAAETFFKWWKPGTVVINGKPPVQHDNNITRINDHFLLIEQISHHIDSDMIVMGSVTYPLRDRQLSRNMDYKYTVVAYVPMGTVDPTPAREALEFNDRTRRNLATIREQLETEIALYIEKQIAESESHSDAVTAFFKWRDTMSRVNLAGIKYKGESIPEVVECPIKELFIYEPHTAVFDTTVGAYSGKAQETRRISISDLREYNIIVNYDRDHFKNSRDRAKIRAWAEQNGIKRKKFYIFTGDVPGSPWTDGITKHDWSVIKEINPDARHTAVTNQTTANATLVQIKDTIPTIIPSRNPDRKTQNYDITDIPKGMQILLMSPATALTRQDIFAAFPDSATVILAKNRWDKFKREHKNAKDISEALLERTKEAQKKLNRGQIFQIANHPPFNITFHNMNKKDIERIDDPKLQEYMLLFTVKPEDKLETRRISNELHTANYLYQKSQTKKKRAHRVNRWSRNVASLTLDDETEELVNHVKLHYPFLSYVRTGSFQPHDYDYVNAMYAYRTTQNKTKKKTERKVA